MDLFKEVCGSDGKGGWICPCCGPLHKTDRKKWRKRARHRLKQMLTKEINDTESTGTTNNTRNIV